MSKRQKLIRWTLSKLLSLSIGNDKDNLNYCRSLLYSVEKDRAKEMFKEFKSIDLSKYRTSEGIIFTRYKDKMVY